MQRIYERLIHQEKLPFNSTEKFLIENYLKKGSHGMETERGLTTSFFNKMEIIIFRSINKQKVLIKLSVSKIVWILALVRFSVSNGVFSFFKINSFNLKENLFSLMQFERDYLPSWKIFFFEGLLFEHQIKIDVVLLKYLEHSI